jgi:hypothetical protein
MTSLVRLFLAVVGASVLSVVALAHAPVTSDNVLEVVIGSGPRAGTYKPPTSTIICMHAKQQKQFTAAYKDFGAGDPAKISVAVINVDSPDEAGPRHGDVLVSFGDTGDKKHPSEYSVTIPGGGTGPLTLTLTRTGKGADLAFEGKTKDGIPLHVTAKCTSITEL